MKSTTFARLVVMLLVGGGFALLSWQLLETAPQTSRERPAAPIPLVDVIASDPADYPARLAAAGTVVSAHELEIRPQVGGRITALHPAFEPGGHIPAGATVAQIDDADYRLAVTAAEAEVAKARASIALEQGRRVVAREELDSLKGSLTIDAASQALALRRPQLRQVQADLAAAQNHLERARLDLARTAISLPYDVVVLERARVSGEVVAARELIGLVTRADRYWVDLRTQPTQLARVQVRDGDTPGSHVTLRDGATEISGEVVRIRADVASGSRLAGVIAAIPLQPSVAPRILLGSYVDADIDAGTVSDTIRIPRRALRDNGRVWVVDGDGTLRVRDARVSWEYAQTLLLARDTLLPGDRVVVSRISGLVPGASVRAREVEPDATRAGIATVIGDAGDD